MSIHTLMSAAHAAGYVMAVEDELPESFGTEPTVFEFKAKPSTEVAIWRPVNPSIDGKPFHASGHMSHAWDWVMGRFAGGATA